MIEIRADLRGRSSKAGPEGSIEIGHIGKAYGGGDIADLARFARGLAQRSVRRQQALLQDEVGEGFAAEREDVLDVARAHTVVGGDVLESQVRISETSQDRSLDRVEANCGKSPVPGDVAGISGDPERKCHEVENILRGHVVGGGIELGPEPVRGLDLVQEKIANLTLGNRPRNLILDVPANIGDLLMGNSNAPSIALRKLSYPGLLTAAHQCHISRRKIDGPAALGGSHWAT